MTKAKYRDLASELIGIVGGMPSQEQCVDTAKVINKDPILHENCDADLLWDMVLQLAPDVGGIE